MLETKYKLPTNIAINVARGASDAICLANFFLVSRKQAMESGVTELFPITGPASKRGEGLRLQATGSSRARTNN